MSERDDPVVVFKGPSWQAEEMQSLLANAGIESFLRDEVMGRIDAPLLASGAMAAVKLVVASEYARRAEQVIRDFGGEGGVTTDSDLEVEPAPPATAAADWICPDCAQTIEGQFDVCWNCGAARPA